MSYIYYAYKNDIISDAFTPATYKVALCESAPAVGAANPLHGDLVNVATAAGSPVTPTVAVTYTNGVIKPTSATATFSALNDGTKSYDTLVLYNDTGTAGTRRLMCMIDGFTAIVPNGGDVIVNWDAASSMNGQNGGIFAL